MDELFVPWWMSCLLHAGKTFAVSCFWYAVNSILVSISTAVCLLVDKDSCTALLTCLVFVHDFLVCVHACICLCVLFSIRKELSLQTE